jgi:YceI-like domain
MGRLKNHNTGFGIFPGSYSKQLRATRILLQRKVYPPVATFVVQSTPLPLFLVLVLFFAGSKQLTAQVSGLYRVDAQQSRIEIHLFKGGFLSTFGDNHLISMTHFSGTADLSRADSWKADLSADATSLKVIDPWGSPSERKEVEDTMLGPQQIDARRFPTIELHSLSFDPIDHDTIWHLVANVKLHGVTRKASFSLDCRQIGDKLQIRGKKMFKLTDFDIQPFSTAFGAVKVKNDFEVTYNIVLDPIQ